jgi:hypothetical protein
LIADHGEAFYLASTWPERKGMFSWTDDGTVFPRDIVQTIDITALRGLETPPLLETSSPKLAANLEV